MVVAGVGGPAYFFCFYLLRDCWRGGILCAQLRKDREMTDQEKIDLLGEALNNLMQSADTYIVDGSWIDELTLDVENARALLKKMPPKSWNVGDAE
jgi:hypothetical protein